MAKEWAKSFYNSKAWQRCRESYINNRRMIDGGLCEECGERLGYIVHHTVMLTPENINDPTIPLNPDTLRWECKPCHDREEGHYIRKKNKKNFLDRELFFDSNGDVIFIDPPRLEKN